MSKNIKGKRYIFLTSAEYGSEIKLDRKHIRCVENEDGCTVVVYHDGCRFAVRETREYIEGLLTE